MIRLSRRGQGSEELTIFQRQINKEVDQGVSGVISEGGAASGGEVTGGAAWGAVGGTASRGQSQGVRERMKE